MQETVVLLPLLDSRYPLSMSTAISQLGELPNKPLVEAVFELRWRLHRMGDILQDPAWDLLPGLMFSRIRDQMPHSIPLPMSAVPPHMMPHVVRHQFRASPNGWPVIQIGPGILTVNQTNDYRTWVEFFDLIKVAVTALHNVFPANAQFVPIQLDLRYVNGLRFISSEGMSIQSFLRDNLHIDLRVNADLFGGRRHNDGDEAELNLTYNLTEPAGIGGVAFSLGETNGHPAIIWQIVIEAKDAQVPQDVEHIFEWLNKAHGVAEDWFEGLSEGPLLTSFKGAQQ